MILRKVIVNDLPLHGSHHVLLLHLKFPMFNLLDYSPKSTKKSTVFGLHSKNFCTFAEEVNGKY